MEIDHNRPVANRSSSRRLQTRIQQNSKISGNKGNTCYIHKFGINFSRSKRTFGKRMYRTCTCKSNYGRFLQHRGHASCYQFTTSKQVSPKTTLQNGYPQNRVKFGTIRRLGSDIGPQRRLSSHTNFQKSQKVSEILHSRQVLPVSIPSIWSYRSPANIYKSCDSSGCLLETTNYSSNSISGRLVDSKSVNKQRFKRSRLCNKSPVVFGVHSQCQEIETLSSPTFCVSRGSVCTRSRDSFSNSRQSNSTECSNSNNSTQNMYSPRLPTSIRSNGFMHSDCTERSLIHVTNTKTSPESLETSISRMGSNNSFYTTAEFSFGMVVKFSQHFERPIVCISNEFCSPHDRCIDVCMGRSYWESSGSRSVVLRRKEFAHKLSRAGGCHSVSETLSTQTERSVCVDTVRQHHSGAIHQQTRGNQVLNSLSESTGTLVDIYPKPNRSQKCSYCRLGKCSCGSVIKNTDKRDRMVSEPVILHRIFQIWGSPSIDLFASVHNHKLPVFCSWTAHPQAYAIDALSISRESMYAYAFPPVCLIPRVLAHVLTYPCRVILIAPLWPRRPWYPQLLQLLIANPIAIPNVQNLLRQPKTKIYHQNPELFNLHAWLISNIAFDQRVFQNELRNYSWRRGGQVLERTTRSISNSTIAGVLKGMSIPIQQL